MSKNILNKTMCILPWIHLHPWPNGKTLLCCESPYEEAVGNIRENSLKEVWNNDKMKQIRLNMLDGKECSECTRCYEKEKHGLESLRVTSNKNWLESHNDKVLATNEDGSLDDMKIVYLDFRFSNVCNLKCRYCGPELSSNWYQDAVKSQYSATPTEQVIQIRKDVDGFMDEFLPMLEHIEQIYWAGGEPLLMDEHWAIMNHLVDIGKTDIRIFYNTNFTTLKYKKHSMTDLWKKFSHISVGASLDASGARAEYQRKGTKWNDIVANRKQLKEECPDIDFYVSCTLSAYNAHHIADFHAEWVVEGLIEPKDFDVNILMHHERFRCSVLPQHHKDEIKEEWKLHIEWLKEHDPLGRATRGFEAAMTFIDDDYSHMLQEFKDYNTEFDKIRGEDFFEVYPEYKDLK
jgi:sulfatase maturation enzyme AslB (radical SAM superfamily)